jgi:cyclic pyranopterin phosphate synthase
MSAKAPKGGGWSHVDEAGDARMVDVSAKTATLRKARAEGFVRMRAETRRAITSGESPKGSVLGAARIAGIQGAKQTSCLIPLCHPLPVEKVRVDFSWDDSVPESSGEARLRIEAEVVVTAKTGVEMEALTAVSVAALTVYDMSKGADPRMVIEGIRVIEKTGGKRDLKV